MIWPSDHKVSKTGEGNHCTLHFLKLTTLAPTNVGYTPNKQRQRYMSSWSRNTAKQNSLRQSGELPCGKTNFKFPLETIDVAFNGLKRRGIIWLVISACLKSLHLQQSGCWTGRTFSNWKRLPHKDPNVDQLASYIRMNGTALSPLFKDVYIHWCWWLW